jgi:hypothetical protein
MTRRVTLKIDRITLPPGTRLDRAALEAALRAEFATGLAGPTLPPGDARPGAQSDGYGVTPHGQIAEPLEAAIARTAIRSARR